MASYTKEERQARKDYAKNRSIIEVAEGLGMELIRSGRDFRWKEHDSMVLSPEKIYGIGFLNIREEIQLL